MPIIGVMGSGSQADESRCVELGRWLAGERVHLLTGGGGGAMSAVSRGFIETTPREGLAIGVLPAAAPDTGRTPPGYPNPSIELAIRTHLHLSGKRGTELGSRNHINVLSSDAIIALPGSWGTRSEVELALRYGKPLVAYLQEHAEIPQLPQEVPVLGSLAEVRAFVRNALGRAP